MSERLRSFINDEFQARLRRNPRYSLRSFAKGLAIDPSVLSKVLSGKRRIGPRLARSLGASVGFKAADQASEDYRRLSIEQFRIVGDWYHFALLELLKVRDFKPDTAWIARALGLSKRTVSAATARLRKAGLLSTSTTDAWADLSTGRTSSILPGASHPAIRQHQRQVLELAIRALDHIPHTERTQTSVTMAIDKRLLPEARERIKTFRRDMDAFLSSSAEKDDVYNLSISLYPVSDTSGGTPK